MGELCLGNHRMTGTIRGTGSDYRVSEASCLYWQTGSYQWVVETPETALKYLKTGIDKAYDSVRLLEPTPDLDLCLVEKLNKDIDALMKRLSDIVEDVLSLPADDITSFNEAASLQDVLGNMTLKLIKLSHNQEHRIMEEAGASSRVQLPKISIPMFNGKVLSG